MKNNTLRLHTSIKPLHKISTLKKGSFIAAIGLIPWVYSSIFLNVSDLHQWGWLIFFTGIMSIGYGMIPYRRLTQLELNPNQITLNNDTLDYFQNGRRKISIPINEINKVKYTQFSNFIDLTNPANLTNLTSLNKLIKFSILKPEPQIYGINIFMKNGMEIFFPYFSQRSATELSLALESEFS